MRKGLMLCLCFAAVKGFKLYHSNTNIKIDLVFLKLAALEPRQMDVLNLAFTSIDCQQAPEGWTLKRVSNNLI